MTRAAPNLRELWNSFPTYVRHSSQKAGLCVVDGALPAGDYSGPTAADELVIASAVTPAKLGYCDLGAGRVRTRKLAARSFAVVCLGSSPSFIHDAPCSARSYGLRVPLLLKVMEEVQPGGSTNLDFGHLHTSFSNNPFVINTLERIWQEVSQPWPGSRLLIESATVAVVLALLREAQIRPREAGRGGLMPGKLRLVLEVMEEHFSEDISLSMLAAIAGVSPTHFSRAFKQSTGKSPFRWLSERRIDRAKELMKNSHLSLAQVALSTGYAAQPQFSTAFLRVAGITPREWRRTENYLLARSRVPLIAPKTMR